MIPGVRHGESFTQRAEPGRHVEGRRAGRALGVAALAREVGLTDHPIRGHLVADGHSRPTQETMMSGIADPQRPSPAHQTGTARTEQSARIRPHRNGEIVLAAATADAYPRALPAEDGHPRGHRLTLQRGREAHMQGAGHDLFLQPHLNSVGHDPHGVHLELHLGRGEAFAALEQVPEAVIGTGDDAAADLAHLQRRFKVRAGVVEATDLLAALRQQHQASLDLTLAHTAFGNQSRLVRIIRQIAQLRSPFAMVLAYSSGVSRSLRTFSASA